MSADFDTVMNNLTNAAHGDKTDLEKLFQLKKLDIDAEDRRVTRELDAERRSEERSNKSDMWKNAITLLGPVFLQMMTKPAIDPALLAIITNQSGNKMDDMKSLLEMQRQQASIQMETMIAGMTQIMTVKDAMNEKLIEKAMEGGDQDTGVMGMLSQAMKFAEPLLTKKDAIAVTPSDSAANPANPAMKTLGHERAAIPVVVLRSLMKIRSGELTPKQTRAAYPAIVATILQDDGLTAAVMGAQADDGQALINYCATFVLQTPDIQKWISQTKDAQFNGEWLQEIILNEIEPRVSAEMDDGEEEDGEDNNAPIQRAPLPAPPRMQLGGVSSEKAAVIEPPELNASNTPKD